MKIHSKILLFLILFLSCSDRNDYIQDVYVNIEMSVDLPEYSELNAVGNSIFITGGVQGIIVYHSNINDYRAFDRNCSYEPSDNCAIIDTVNSTIASCGCCTSKFLLDQNGITVNGPALLPLKEYYTSFSGGILRIKN